MTDVFFWLPMFLLLAFATWLVLGVRDTLKESSPDDADPIAHFKQQLADLAEDEERGVLDASSVASARLEIERRILRVSSEPDTLSSGHGNSKPAILFSAAFLLLGTVGLYALLGTPLAPAAPGQMATVQDVPLEEGGPTYGEAITRIDQHLVESPDDTQGWEVLAKASRAVGDYSQTARAYGQLVRLQPDVMRWHVDRLEAFMAMGKGKVSPAAKLVLTDVLTREPMHPAGHYYLGLSRLQAGNEEGANAIWTALADRSSADAPWVPIVNERLSELGVRPPKLSTEQMAAVNDMSADEQQVFIQSMVQRLRDRLESQPNDPAGWLMLARSEVATGDKQAAISTLKHALSVLPAGKSADLQAFLDNLTGNGNP